ncbi:MAG TPA: cell division protein FtsL [Burkholderiaceae bacterium]|nr:cell division protein FtsL [Burkholderiaceae bacterium]
MSVRIGLVLLAAALVLCALALVTAQQQARNAFIDLERARSQQRQLQAQGDRLRIELERLAQPAAIEAAARRLGLEPLDPARTVLLPLRMAPSRAMDAEQGSEALR